MSTNIDFLVIGDDEVALCAAAIAATSGARTVLLQNFDANKISLPSAPNIPNAVWRRLNLQEYGLALAPVSSRVTLFDDGKTFETTASVQETQRTIADSALGDHAYWQDFIEDFRKSENEELFGELTSGPIQAASSAGAIALTPQRIVRYRMLSGPISDALHDYFENEDLVSHIAAHAVAPHGTGPAVAGSALVLPAFLEMDGWPVRSKDGAPTLRSVLEQACATAGVDIINKKLTAIGEIVKNYRHVTLTGNHIIRVRKIFFSNPDIAASCGIGIGSPPSTQSKFRKAYLRLKLQDSIPPPGGAVDSVFQIADSENALQLAFEQASIGRLPDQLPLTVEFIDNTHIVAVATLSPNFLIENDEERDWTGQDKQALMRLMTERVAKRIDGVKGNIANSRIELAIRRPVDTKINLLNHDNVIVQPHHHNAVSEAIRLVDRALSDG